MDSNKKPLFYLDPMCSALSMLTDVASSRHYRDTSSSIPSLKIKFNMKSFKTVKEPSNVDGSQEASISKKPIKFLASSFAAYSSLKFHQVLIKDADLLLRRNLYSIKTLKEVDNVDGSHGASNSKKLIKFLASSFAALIKDADLPSTSKNPVNFMCPATKEGATSKADDDEDLINNDAENDNVLEPSPTKLLGSYSSNRKRQLGGNEITLLITKSLFDSDLNGELNWLSMPSKQIDNINFLREGELEDLEARKGIEVKLIQPSLEVTNLTLAKWNMRKKNGRISSSYVLRSSSWKQVVQANELKANDKVQVWSFRVQEKLCMAIVKLQ